MDLLLVKYCRFVEYFISISMVIIHVFTQELVRINLLSAYIIGDLPLVLPDKTTSTSIDSTYS